MDPPYVLPIELLLCVLCELHGFFFRGALVPSP